MSVQEYISSKYRYVKGLKSGYRNPISWNIKVLGIRQNGFATEKDAAIAVDKILIQNGKKPVNVLKKK